MLFQGKIETTINIEQNPDLYLEYFNIENDFQNQYKASWLL